RTDRRRFGLESGFERNQLGLRQWQNTRRKRLLQRRLDGCDSSARRYLDHTEFDIGQFAGGKLASREHGEKIPVARQQGAVCEKVRPKGKGANGPHSPAADLGLGPVGNVTKKRTR